MQIPFNEKHAETVKKVNMKDLREIFGMIQFGNNDKAKKEAVDTALSLIETYTLNYPNHEGSFLPKPEPIKACVR